MKCRVRIECGRLAQPSLDYVVDYGRSLGLDVRLYLSGWLTRRGFLTVEGDERDVAKCLAALRQLED